MQYPDDVKRLANVCAEKFPSDIDKAVKEWGKRVQRLKGYVAWRDSLVEVAGRGMIADSRHTKNVAMRKEAGKYGGSPTVIAGLDTRDLSFASYFDYSIDGRRLGDVLFSELPGIAQEQAGKANGFMFNANLCQALYRLKPKKGDDKLENVLKESQVRKLITKQYGWG